MDAGPNVVDRRVGPDVPTASDPSIGRAVERAALAASAIDPRMFDVLGPAQDLFATEALERAALAASAIDARMFDVLGSAQDLFATEALERAALAASAIDASIFDVLGSAQDLFATEALERAALAASAIDASIFDVLGSAQESVGGFLEAGLPAIAHFLAPDPELEAIWLAVDAAIWGDRASLRAFVWTHLRLVPTPAHLEAATDALLDLMNEPVSSELTKRLRNRTIELTRAHRFLGETQIRGQRIDYLDRPFSGPGDPLTVGDKLAPLPDPSDLILTRLDAGRILPDLRDRLTAQEERIVAHHLYDGLTWADSARVENCAAIRGDAVRRKVRRFGELVFRRRPAQ